MVKPVSVEKSRSTVRTLAPASRARAASDGLVFLLDPSGNPVGATRYDETAD
jgi:hypothetical protein